MQACGVRRVGSDPKADMTPRRTRQETVQRSPGWDWIFTFVVAEMRASGYSVLLS